MTEAILQGLTPKELDELDFSFFNALDVDVFAKAQAFDQYLGYLKSNDRFHYQRASITGSQAVVKVLDHAGHEHEMVYFASNDYLNLTRHPKTIAAGVEACKQYGAGAGSVPLLGGRLGIHVKLEERVAKFKACKSAINYTSGFGSNCGSLLALLGEKDLAVLDLLSHASLIDGCKNTNTKFFHHNDMASLAKVLDRAKGQYRTIIVVCDGVYSMDGDIAPLKEIVEIAHNYGAYVMVDDAHASGVIGPNGRGTAEHWGIEGQVDIVAGTFSKGMGCVGGFIASEQALIELLRFYSRHYMFSTAMTPQAAGSIIAAMDVIEEEPELRNKLWENINYFRKNLVDLGFNIGNAETAVFPIIIGDNCKVQKACETLQNRGVYANPVLFPAVPKRLSRLRFSLMSCHTKEHLDLALNCLEDIGKELQII